MTEEGNISFIGVNDLRIGSYLMMADKPCVIIKMTTSKTGKHGSAKAHITGKDIFTDKKIEVLMSTSEMATIPIVTKISYTLLDLGDDDSVSLLDDHLEEQIGIVKMDSSDEVCQKVKKLFEENKTVIVTVISALSQSKIFDCSEAKE